MFALAARLAAQQAPLVQPEARVDAIVARDAATQLGGGASIVLGTYVRLAFIGGAGTRWRDGSGEFSGRADAMLRFLFDPLREARWAPYGAGGLGLLYDASDRWRAVVIAAIGAEGPPKHGIVPAFELGLGGGVRAGIVVRRARAGRR
jgi:hypothetical protein